MAIINELEVLYDCGCGNASLRIVQFRYGFLRLVKYRIGSTIVWRSPSVGGGPEENACVQGWITSCASCGIEGDVAVILVRGQIAGVASWPVDAALSPDLWSVYSHVAEEIDWPDGQIDPASASAPKSRGESADG